MALPRLIRYGDLFRTRLVEDIDAVEVVLLLVDASGLPDIDAELLFLDWGFVLDNVVDFIDYGLVADPPDEFEDWGEIFIDLDGDYYYLSLFDDLGVREIVKVIGRSVNFILVERGQDGTVGIPIAAGDRVELWFARATIDDIQDEISDACDLLETDAALSLADATANESDLSDLSDQVDLNTAAISQNTTDVGIQVDRLNSIEMVDLDDVLANGRDGFIEAQNNSGADSNNRLALASDISGGSPGELLATFNLTEANNGQDFPFNFPVTKGYFLMWTGQGVGDDDQVYTITFSVDASAIATSRETVAMVGGVGQWFRPQGGNFDRVFTAGSHDIRFTWTDITIDFLDVYIFSGGTS